MFKHYPKLSAIALTYLLAFGVFAALGPDTAHHLVEPLGIGGIIVAGALYTYGFTASLGAVVLFALVPDYSPVMLALLGGFGATVADLTIFRFMKGTLHKEVLKISHSPIIKYIVQSRAARTKWIRNAAGFFIIASPLPDEIGIALISMTRMNEETFRIVDFCANVLGIYALAYVATMLY